MKVAGIDGTKAGWVVAVWRDGELSAFAAPSFHYAMERLDDAVAIGIDMPIGFMDAAEPGGRVCEKAARSAMPGRASSVFSSPCRTALQSTTHAQASALNRESSHHGIGLSQQSFALFGKMREIDEGMTPDLQERAFEVHPELCFSMLAERLREGARLDGKKSISGMLARCKMLGDVGFDPEPLLKQRKTLRAGEDDVIDACVAAWSAWRRARGEAIRFPHEPPRDSRGLAMEMWA